MKLFGASLNQTLSLRIGVFSKRKSNRKERNPKTPSKNRNSKCVKSSCLPDKPLWTRPKGCYSNITEFSQHPARKHLHKVQQHQAGAACGTLNSISGTSPSLCWEWTLNWLSCGTESINAWPLGVLGVFSLRHKCCKAARNRNSKSVSQGHELLPKKMIPSPEMKTFR